MRALVYEHCKKLIENLMLQAAQENENVARTLLQYRSNITDTLTLIAEDRDIAGTVGMYSTPKITIDWHIRDSRHAFLHFGLHLVKRFISSWVGFSV